MSDVVDLRGVACPGNYVRAKLALEPLEPGAEVEIWLDAGEPVANVPRSLRDDGDRVLAVTDAGEHFVVRVRKGEPSGW